MNLFRNFLTRTTRSSKATEACSVDEHISVGGSISTGTNIYLVVGLGNPGAQYEHTRHNAGFDTIDLISEDLHSTYWKTECGALTTKAVYHDFDLILAKPQGFMNTSGGPVKLLCNAYAIDPDHLIVVHDEIDIDTGTIKVKFGGGHAGHNGLRSIGDKLGTRDWFRVRIGVGRPPGRMEVADYVLTVPRKEAMDDLNQACNLGRDAVYSLLDAGLERTQQEFN